MTIVFLDFHLDVLRHIIGGLFGDTNNGLIDFKDNLFKNIVVNIKN
jgi:hypothetical protein